MNQIQPDEPKSNGTDADEASGGSAAPERSTGRRTFVLKRRDDSALETRFRIRYADELNAAQLSVAEQIDGPVLVVAGAGTGKTRTLVYRVARMIESGIAPESILLLTFTRKAAQQMLRRAAELVGPRAEHVQGGTFHSFANLTLRRHAEAVGYAPGFTILDQGDCEDVINLLRARIGLDARGLRFPRKQSLAAMISASVNRLTPLSTIIEEDYPQYRRQIEDIEKLARSYQQYKHEHSLMDYDDLLINMSLLLERNNDVRERLAGLHRYIMVDEYQDTNRLQHEIVRQLGERHRNVMVVGDDSQSIYSFRGANFRNIMDFPKTFPGTMIITLEENYRSTQPILNLTNEILRHATEKYEKNLFTRRTSGEMPVIISAGDEQLQSQFVVQRILELREEGVELSDIAVLFRSSYLSFDLEIELNKANIPYVKMGGFKFIETAHVKDLISYLRVLNNPRDVVSWNRILLLLPGVGPRTAQRLVDEITSDQLRLGPGSEEPARRIGNSATGELFAMLSSLTGERMSVPEIVERLVEYYRPIMRGKYDDYTKRLKDVEMFAEIAARYRSLGSFLADMALEPPTESVIGMEAGTEDEKLVLSTIHSAKGLEYNSVFVIWALDGRFPSFYAARSLDEMEEERRLMYVATTRAKDRLVITYPTNIFDRETGTVLSKPSRFIEGLPGDIAERWVVAEE
ncbi:MAG TPA: ATP-dependent helicase [Candidatus Kapabacteria bacterium]|nr:ATP-dependent helicase [Candidatus Kapabacteria bacterium]